MSTPGAIILNSPIGAKPAVYQWPLYYVSRGNKFDGAEEIIETIRWVAREFNEFKPAIENIIPPHPDTKSYEFVKGLCDKYNKILEMVTKMNKGTSVAPKTSSRASQGLLKHIIQQVYNYAVADPNELNKYSPFSSETYGETNFDFMAQLIEKNQFRPKENDIFIDLGSGVGHLVLQMAASVDCKKCYGIEISDVPAGYAKKMEERFKFWMNWHGKTYTEFELIHADFFASKYADIIKNASYILVNNYAFKPEVDHKLKQRFLDLKDGVQILSSKPFCSPKSRVSERHLTDIGSIMRVVEILPEQKKDTVSWTPKPLPYYLHILDASPVEKYYERKKRRQGRSLERGKPGKRRKVGKGDGSDDESDDNVVYGPTTRKAWSEWCNSTTNASNRASTDSIKSSRNNSTDTENYESAIENEEKETTTATPIVKPKEAEVQKRERRVPPETQNATTDKSASATQGTGAQTKASQSANQAAKSCLDKKRDYASKKGTPNAATQNEKSYSCLTKTSDVSNGSSPSKVPPLVIKVTPPVDSRSSEDSPSKASATTAASKNETTKLEPKVNDENGKKLRQRKRSTNSQTSPEKVEKPVSKAKAAKQEAKGPQASGSSLASTTTNLTRSAKRAQQTAKPAAKPTVAAKKRTTSQDKSSSLDLLHTKTVESVSGNAGYFPQPAPGCEDYNLRSIVETPSLPKVTIKDVSMYNDYVKKCEDRCLEMIRAEVGTFLRKTMQPGCRDTLIEQVKHEQMKNMMLAREAAVLQRDIKALNERIPRAMKVHCDELQIKNTPRNLVAHLGNLLKKYQDLSQYVLQLEQSLNSNQRTMNPPAAHSNSALSLTSPYHRGSASSATLDLSLK